jgi:hypothetical protein
MDRLFCSVRTEPFLDVAARTKIFEVRPVSPNFNENTVYTNRVVDYVLGYSRERMRGTIGRVLCGQLEEVLEAIPLSEVEPRCSSKEEIIRKNIAEGNYRETSTPYIAFELVISEEEKRKAVEAYTVRTGLQPL